MPDVVEGGEDVLDIPAETADGGWKPRRDWRVEDWRAWGALCERMVDGWYTQQEGSGAIEKLLLKHRVDRTADLPPAALEKVRGIVRGFRA
jgi:hypothetical protein